MMKTTPDKLPLGGRMTEAQRRRAIRLHQAGENASSIGGTIGFSGQAILKLIGQHQEIGEACFTPAGGGRSKAPRLTQKDKIFLRKMLPRKSPVQMNVPGGGEKMAQWTAVEVQQLVLARGNYKANLAECAAFLREIGLTPVPHTRGGVPLPVYHNWREKLSDAFLDWNKNHRPKSLKRLESAAVRRSKKRLSLRKRGAPTLSQRVWTTPKEKYHLNDPLLESPRHLAEPLENLANQLNTP